MQNLANSYKLLGKGASLECGDLSPLWSQRGLHSLRWTKAPTSRRTPRRRSIIYTVVHMRNLLQTNAPAAVILIRIVVGGIFLSEGVQKFLYPAENGAGRFAKIGIPSPDVIGPFVGVVEIVCGALILIGFSPGSLRFR